MNKPNFMSRNPDVLSDTHQDPEQAELIQLLASQIAPVVPQPPTVQALSARLVQRIARSAAQSQQFLTVRSRHGAWQILKPGIRFKLLWRGDYGNSVLVEFAPGASLPSHRHQWLEEGIVLSGGLQMGELDLAMHDYHVTPQGSHHGSIRSRQGALAYLRGTSLGQPEVAFKELLGGLLPFGKAQSRTIYSQDTTGWRTLKPGVKQKILYVDDGLCSSLCRLEPGAVADSHGHLEAEECMMLAGELFLGDILLRAGDYQLAPAGTHHEEVYTDVGALLFVRGAAA